METFKKRQKEMKRLEKQRDKAARRMQRKQERATGAGETPSDDDLAMMPGEPGESPELEPKTEL